MSANYQERSSRKGGANLLLPLLLGAILVALVVLIIVIATRKSGSEDSSQDRAGTSSAVPEVETVHSGEATAEYWRAIVYDDSQSHEKQDEQVQDSEELDITESFEAMTDVSQTLGHFIEHEVQEQRSFFQAVQQTPTRGVDVDLVELTRRQMLERESLITTCETAGNAIPPEVRKRSLKQLQISREQGESMDPAFLSWVEAAASIGTVEDRHMKEAIAMQARLTERYKDQTFPLPGDASNQQSISGAATAQYWTLVIYDDSESRGEQDEQVQVDTLGDVLGAGRKPSTEPNPATQTLGDSIDLYVQEQRNLLQAVQQTPATGVDVDLVAMVRRQALEWESHLLTRLVNAPLEVRTLSGEQLDRIDHGEYPNSSFRDWIKVAAAEKDEILARQRNEITTMKVRLSERYKEQSFPFPEGVQLDNVSASDQPSHSGTFDHPALPPEYVRVATLIADKLTSDRQRLDERAGEGEARAELHGITALRTLETADVDLKTAAQESAQAAAELLQGLEALHSLPQAPEDLETFIAGCVTGYTGNPTPLLAVVSRANSSAAAFKAQFQRLEASYQKERGAQLLLGRTAAKYGGPLRANEKILAVDYDDEWDQGEVDGHDYISLTNTTDRDLTNCTVIVQLIGSDSKTRQHLHFVPEWKAGASLHGKYSCGISLGEDQLFQGTVYRPRTLRLTLYCDQLSQEEVEVAYWGVEGDKDLKRVLEPLGLRARYRPYAKGLLFDDQHSVIVSFSGLPYLLGGKATVTLHHGGDRYSRDMPFQAWLEGTDLQIDFPELRWEPEKFEITISFEGSAYSKVFYWEL